MQGAPSDSSRQVDEPPVRPTAMTMSVRPPQVPRELGDPAELAPEASLFARIEDLINEEHALLLIPATERGRRDHERLREIEDLLDRILEKLRERSRPPGEEAAKP